VGGHEAEGAGGAGGRPPRVILITGIGNLQGTLILAGVPIGRPQDASAALIAALGTADVIAAEDTRRLRRLAAALGVRLTGRLVSFYEDVEAARVPALIDELTSGRDVLLLTDAGMPSVSDPGYRLVTAAVAAGLAVTILPGPSAVTAALAVSGLPSDRFCFEGFPPRKAGERTRRFAELAGERRTMVFFESPRRLGVTLTGLRDAFGLDRAAVVCRELTKTHEEIIRGSLAELADWAAAREVLGEITLVVGGASGPGSEAGPADPEEAAMAVAAAERTGMTRSEAIAATAVRLGMRKREVYDAVVAAKHAKHP
jgi:16S rRNA (cytidine1402-2'-O)-methyltransferase